MGSEGSTEELKPCHVFINSVLRLVWVTGYNEYLFYMISAAHFLPQDDVDAEGWQGFKSAWKKP